MFSILVSILVLSILILVHELGHFGAAKRAGVWVEEFGVGLPPKIWGKKIGETIYSVNALPFGGFVRLHGENTEDGVSKPKRAFINKSKKARASIVVAGVVMNFLLAILAFSIVYTKEGIPKIADNVVISEVSKASPAELSGLISGDIILKIDDTTVSSLDQFIKLAQEKAGEEVVLVYEREGVGIAKVNLVPREDPPAGQGALGVVIKQGEVFFPPVWQRPFYGVYYGFREAIFWGKTIVLGFVMVFSELFTSGKVPPGIAGPVGVYAITTKVATFGIMPLINFLGVFSINLAILNIIPFPALDGGRLLFIGIEAVIGRKVSPKIEGYIHTVGMLLLIIAILAITTHDVRGLISAGSISGFLDSLGQ